MRRFAYGLFALAVVAAACSHATAPSPVPPTLGGGSGKIEHVVFVVQENRTFDNIFGGPSPLPNATAATQGMTTVGPTPLTQVNLENNFGGGDPNNYHFQWLTACNAPTTPPFPVGAPAPCRMNGFNLNAKQQKGYPAPPGPSVIYSYVNRAEVAPYWFIAQHYEVGDHFFMGHNSESYTAHQYIFSSQSNGTVDSPVYPSSVSCGLSYEYCAYTPWGCDSPAGTLTYKLNTTTGAWNGPPAAPTGPFPCYGSPGGNGYLSIADLAQRKGVSWRVYAYSMCSNILGLDVNASIRKATPPPLWPDGDKMANCHADYGIVNPLTADSTHFRAPQYAFLTDESSGNVPLAAVTWILPGPYTSDHPGVPRGYCGPTWVAKVVNAIGNSPDWQSTVIFVLWDDWGGFYDSVPPYVVRDQAGPGFRVPLLVISPYVNAGSVVHTEIEFGTLNKFVETTFGLGSLGATDASPYLHDLDAFFNFNQQPQKFTTVPFPSGFSYSRCSYLPDARHPGRRAARSRWIRMVAPGTAAGPH